MSEETTVPYRVAKLTELKEDLLKLDEKRTKITDKIAELERESQNEAVIESLKAGDNVAYVYGRAASKRVLTGTVRATNRNDKGVVQLKVESGEGFDAEFHLIDASALLFSAEEVEKANIEIAEAKAEADAKAADKKKEGDK